jgi:hypothetical protein
VAVLNFEAHVYGILAVVLSIAVRLLFAVVRCSSLFLAAIIAVFRCYFPGRNAETRGFQRDRPILPAVFSGNNSDISGAWRRATD